MSRPFWNATLTSLAFAAMAIALLPCGAAVILSWWAAGILVIGTIDIWTNRPTPKP